MENRVKLVRIHGATDIRIAAEIMDNGDPQISGQDLGEAPQQLTRDIDYQYCLRVAAVDKDRVLLALGKAVRE